MTQSKAQKQAAKLAKDLLEKQKKEACDAGTVFVPDSQPGGTLGLDPKDPLQARIPSESPSVQGSADDASVHMEVERQTHAARNIHTPSVDEPRGGSPGASRRARSTSIRPNPYSRRSMEPRPLQGITFGSGRNKIQKTIDEERPLQTIEETPDANPAVKEAAERAKARREAFLKKVKRTIQTPALRAIHNIPKSTDTIRYTPHVRWTDEIVIWDEKRTTFFADKTEGNGGWIWAAVQGTNRPGVKEALHLKDALLTIEQNNEIKDFNRSQYKIMQYTNQGGYPAYVLTIFCDTDEARKRLLLMANFGFKTDDLDMVFMLQDMYSIGSHIVIDLKNAPASEEEIVKGCSFAFSDILSWKLKDDKYHVSDFRITCTDIIAPAVKIQGRPGARNAPSKVIPLPTYSNTPSWRIAFEANPKEAEDWMIPNMIDGSSTRGDIWVKPAPFCSACMSDSHAIKHCNLWKAEGVMGKKPAQWEELVWNKRTFSVTKTAMERFKLIKQAAREAKKNAPTGGEEDPFSIDE